MAKDFSFDFTRGDTKSIVFGITDENGDSLNLTEQDDIYFTIKKNYKTNDIILQKKLSRGELSYADGELIVGLTHNDTKGLNYGTYVYDIEVSLSNESLVSTPFLRRDRTY